MTRQISQIHMRQASKFSAHGLNSAPGRSILVILEISVNPLRKKNPSVGGGSKFHVNWLGNDYYLHKLRKVLLTTENATAYRGSVPWSPIKGSPLGPMGSLDGPQTPGRTGGRWCIHAFQPLQTSSIWRPDENSLHRVRSDRSWNSPFVTIIVCTWHGESLGIAC